MGRRLALAVGLAVANCHGAPAFAANEPVSSLAPRGAVAGTDQLPILANGATSLQAAYASDLKKYALTSIDTYGADPTGATDSTAAIQAALNSGHSLTCSGVYATSATLNVNAIANHGQILAGSGATDGGGVTTAGRCIFRPAVGMTGNVFLIDGTPFSGYVQGVEINDVTVDMANMSDLGTNVAFAQLQAFDVKYNGDRVINYGNNKVSWTFSAGSYTTLVQNSAGSVVSMQGVTLSNAATTITLLNDDILSISHSFYQNVNLIGGAVQGPYQAGVTPITYLATASPYAFLPNIGGIYIAVTSIIQNSANFSSNGADWEALSQPPATCSILNTNPWYGQWAFGTYNDGVHGCLPIIMAIEVAPTAKNTVFFNPQFAGEYLYDLGVNTTVRGVSSAVGADIHNGAEYELGSVGVFGDVFGFTSLPNLLNTNASITYAIHASSGTANFLGETLRPATDGDQVLSVKTAAGLSVLDCATNAVQCAINNGATLAGYSDSFTTQAWNLNVPSTGTAQLLLKGAGSTTITLTGANGTGVFTGGINSTPVGASTPSAGAFTTLSATNGVTSSTAISATTEIYPGTGSATQASGGLLAGAGNPGSGVGSNGDFYYRIDCIHASSDCVWHKESGGWVDLN